MTHLKINDELSLENQNSNQRSYYYLPNSVFLRLTFYGKSASKS